MTDFPPVQQVEEESLPIVMKIQGHGSRSGTPKGKVEITDSGEL